MDDYESVKETAEIRGDIKRLEDRIDRGFNSTNRSLGNITTTIDGLVRRVNTTNEKTIRLEIMFGEHTKAIDEFKSRSSKKLALHEKKIDKHEKFIDQLSSMPLVWKGVMAILGAIATILGIIAYTK